VFELDDDVDLSSPSLRNILSNEQPTPALGGITAPTATTHAELRNREPTEEEWETE